MTTVEAAASRTEECEVIIAKNGVHIAEPDEDRPDANYRITTRRGRTLAHAQTLNLNGAHPAALPPGTEIGVHPGCQVEVVVDPGFNGEDAGPLVWLFLDTDERQ